MIFQCFKRINVIIVILVINAINLFSNDINYDFYIILNEKNCASCYISSITGLCNLINNSFPSSKTKIIYDTKDSTLILKLKSSINKDLKIISNNDAEVLYKYYSSIKQKVPFIIIENDKNSFFRLDLNLKDPLETINEIKNIIKHNKEEKIEELYELSCGTILESEQFKDYLFFSNTSNESFIFNISNKKFEKIEAYSSDSIKLKFIKKEKMGILNEIIKYGNPFNITNNIIEINDSVITTLNVLMYDILVKDSLIDNQLSQTVTPYYKRMLFYYNYKNGKVAYKDINLNLSNIFNKQSYYIKKNLFNNNFILMMYLHNVIHLNNIEENVNLILKTNNNFEIIDSISIAKVARICMKDSLNTGRYYFLSNNNNNLIYNHESNLYLNEIDGKINTINLSGILSYNSLNENDKDLLFMRNPLQIKSISYPSVLVTDKYYLIFIVIEEKENNILLMSKYSFDGNIISQRKLNINSKSIQYFQVFKNFDINNDYTVLTARYKDETGKTKFISIKNN